MIVGGSNNRVTTGSGDDVITLTSGSNLIDAGGGTNMVFIGGTTNETFELHLAGDDVISGFDVNSNDMLRLRMLLSEAHVSMSGSFSQLGTYLHATSNGGSTSLAFDASGQFAGHQTEIASLVGTTATLAELQGRGAIKPQLRVPQ